jgi:hypothetical protein
MAVKTFSSGEVLTASDTNTYLANSGLVYITSGALSSTATNFVGCFSSTYDNYRIIISNFNPSVGADLYIRLLSGTTPTSTGDWGWAYTGISEMGVSTNSNATSNSRGYTGISNTFGTLALGSASMDCYSPNLAQRTTFTSNAVSYSGAFGGRLGIVFYNNTPSYDGIRFLTDSAATMNGTVTIYGYRKA